MSDKPIPFWREVWDGIVSRAWWRWLLDGLILGFVLGTTAFYLFIKFSGGCQ